MSQQELTQQLERLKVAVADAVEQAKKLGADQAEVAISRQQGLSVGTRNREVETVEFNQDGALGISLYLNGCKGTSSTSDLSPEAIKQAVGAAFSIAKYTQADKANGLADAELMATDVPDLDLCHPRNFTPAELEALALRAETAAFDAGISQSDGANASAHTGIKVYGNSHGFLHGKLTSRYGLSMVAIAEQDGRMQRDYDYTSARNFDELWTPERVGSKAAEKVNSRLGARKLDTQTLPVVFDREIATGLIGHFIHGISGGALYRKSSFLLDKVGKQLFPSWFQAHENPLIKGGLGSAAYDSEGVATKAADIVKDGVLQQYLLTSYSARKMGMQTTGHAGGIYNWHIADTGVDFDGILKQMDRGILVTEVMGQGVNTVNGDYSRGAAGFYVENGQIQYPVEEFTIAGNLKDMYANLVAIDNQRETRSSIGTGAILLESMKIAGN
ncbi:metalloprotease PmbA [Paraferrimonas sedimenticola]|uniref:Peptidase PMbA n=1 Tax=Paraferrimonas sedimenticola TaxID=375674 RepID=A0AA37RVV4_9GAMM|nr:metalloprotease PmbA [Paraferrimonas sedimenticola]GLP95838.1 peptidase PMbA [Paraferrimonas sedimenticola]